MTAFEKNHIVFHGIIVFNQIVKFLLKISYDQKSSFFCAMAWLDKMERSMDEITDLMSKGWRLFE